MAFFRLFVKAQLSAILKEHFTPVRFELAN